MTDVLAQAAGVDSADHLAENLGRLIAQRYLRVEAGWERRPGGRANDDGGQGEKVVGLDDHRITATVLHMTALAWHRDRRPP